MHEISHEEGDVHSVAPLTTTNRLKLSSTNTRTAPLRASSIRSKCATPRARSGYVACGCARDRYALGSKVRDVKEVVASDYMCVFLVSVYNRALGE